MGGREDIPGARGHEEAGKRRAARDQQTRRVWWSRARLQVPSE